jgi:acetyl-CoA acyltransferase
VAYGATREAWIVGAVRTPVGKQGGALSAVRPDDLGALVLEALAERAGVPAEEVEDVYFGCTNQAGEDNRDVARMSLLLAGFPAEVAGATVNRLCGSGLEAVAQAARNVMLGEAHVYVGGGVESMSRAPWAVPKPERAFPTGHRTMYDTTLGWRFVNPKMEEMGHTDTLGMTAENLAEERYEVTSEEEQPEGLAREYDISRERQDRFALRSHEKAIAATDEKRFREEIVPVTVKTRKGEDVVEADEGPKRGTSLEKLSKLKPAFKEGGTVTAGNSSSLNDGAAAVMVVSAEYAEAHGLKPMDKEYGDGRRPAARHGRRPRTRHPEGPRAGRGTLRRHRPHRAKRGLRRAVTGGAIRVGDGLGERETKSKRRSDRDRAPLGLLWRAHPNDARTRDGAAPRG